MEAAPLPRARMPYKHNEPRRHRIPKAKYKVSNWREYDEALQQRGSLTVWVTPEALEAWAPEKTVSVVGSGTLRGLKMVSGSGVPFLKDFRHGSFAA